MTTSITTQMIVDVVVHLANRLDMNENAMNVFKEFLYTLLLEKKYDDLDAIYAQYNEEFGIFRLMTENSTEHLLEWVKCSNVLVSNREALFYFACSAKMRIWGEECFDKDCCVAIAHLIHRGVDEDERNSEGKTWKEVVDDDVKELVREELEKLKEGKHKKAKGAR